MARLTRIEAWELVRNAVAEAGLGKSALYGSWLHGDFHYDANRANSVSDIDLVLPGWGNKERDSAARAVRERLPPYFVSEVTTRTKDDLRKMQLEKQHWYVLSAHTAILRRVSSGQLLAVYSLCKTLLLLTRIHQHERYQSVTDRIGSQSTLCALQVKLGSRRDISCQNVRDLAIRIPRPHRDVLYELLRANPQFRAVGERIMYSLATGDGSVPESVLEHAKRRLFGAVV